MVPRVSRWHRICRLAAAAGRRESPRRRWRTKQGMRLGSLELSDSSGFSMFALDSPRDLRTIRAKIERLKADHIAMLASAQDWPDYKERKGVILGLELALHECDEMEQAERA